MGAQWLEPSSVARQGPNNQKVWSCVLKLNIGTRYFTVGSGQPKRHPNSLARCLSVSPGNFSPVCLCWSNQSLKWFLCYSWTGLEGLFEIFQLNTLFCQIETVWKNSFMKNSIGNIVWKALKLMMLTKWFLVWAQASKSEKLGFQCQVLSPLLEGVQEVT